MTDIDPVTKVARDLTEIVKLAALLEDQALHLANDRMMPGGLAMVSLAADADLDEWGERIAYLELQHYARCTKSDHRKCRVADHVFDEDDQDNEDPLRSLLFWSEAWREENGYPLEGRKPTIGTEAGFVRHMLDWAWDNELHWDDFARDVNQARRRLEALMHSGRQSNRTRVNCDRMDCETKPRLLRVYTSSPATDHFKCPACKRRYDAQEFADTYARHLRSAGAARFVPKSTAVDLLRGQGRSAHTISRWFKDGKVETRLEPSGIRTVWWPDLWHLHLNTPTRRRSA